MKGRKAAWLVCWLAMLFGVAHGLSQSNTVSHRLCFFIHPDLAAGLSAPQVQARLTRYAQDLNLIFGRNTVRRFVFDATTNIFITNSPPPHGYYSGALPETNYEMWVVVDPAASTPYPYTHGGYMSFSTNGAGVAAGLYWDAIHDRDRLWTAQPDDWDLWNYWRQIDTLAHEFGHVFGAGVGEYYSLRNVQDTTGAGPIQDLYYPDYGPSADPYWSAHPDYWHDPMMVWTPQLGLAELLDKVRFAHVTAAMINAGLRNVFPQSRYLPELSATTVRVLAGVSPVPNAPVRAWKVFAHPPYTCEQVFQGLSDSSGSVQFAWSGAPDNEDNLLLVKAWPASAPAVSKWYSLYDAQEQKMVFGRSSLTIYLNAASADSPPALAIQRGLNQVMVSWPINAPGYALEHARSLSDLSWDPVVSETATNGSFQSMNWPSSVAARGFFRLRRW